MTQRTPHLCDNFSLQRSSRMNVVRHKRVFEVATSVPSGSLADHPGRWDIYRKWMPVTHRWAYFDHAAVAPLPQPTAEAISKWCQQATQEGDTVWLEWNRDVERVHDLTASMINAEPAEIALVSSTTAGITLVAEGFPWQNGDNVVTLANEFPSNLYPWMNLASRGVETRRVEVHSDGRVDLDRLLAACDGRTQIVSLSWVGFASGFRLDLPKVVEAVHDRGAYIFLDAIQGLGVFPLDVKQVPVDFLAADGHKWMMGPEGAGIFFVRKQHLDMLRPLGVGWNSVTHRHDFSKVELTLRPTAARYEGGSQNMAGFLGLGASLEMLMRFGVSPNRSPVAERILEITDYAVQQLCAAGAAIVSVREDPHRSGIVAFRLDGQDHDTVRGRCLRAGVVLSHRNGCLRISPHAYVNEDDVDRLVAATRGDRDLS